jgi:hypothetical protein
MEFTSFNLHRRDVHQAEARVTFAGSDIETILYRDDNGNFNCPLSGCPLITPKPRTIQAHCKKHPFTNEDGVTPAQQG